MLGLIWQVVEALELAKAALSKIRANLAWALVYNVVALPLAAGALLPAFGLALTPSTAGGMMAFSSLAVVANSLALNSQFQPLQWQQHQERGRKIPATSRAASAPKSAPTASPS